MREDSIQAIEQGLIMQRVTVVPHRPPPLIPLEQPMITGHLQEGMKSIINVQ